MFSVLKNPTETSCTIIAVQYLNIFKMQKIMDSHFCDLSKKLYFRGYVNTWATNTIVSTWEQLLVEVGISLL